MKAYLESKGLRPRLDEVFKTGDDVDLLSSDSQVFAWNGKGSSMQSRARVRSSTPGRIASTIRGSRLSPVVCEVRTFPAAC